MKFVKFKTMKPRKNLLIYFVIFFSVLLLGILLYLLLNKEEEVVIEEEVVEKILAPSQDVVDFDGNSYKTVQVGDQVWMAENLRTNSFSGESWCYNGQDNYCHLYGRLYTWEAVMDGETEPGSQGLCPNGWHVPTDAEWSELEAFFATGNCNPSRLDWGCFPAGTSLKTTTWGGDNSSTLGVLAAGIRDRRGKYSFLGSYSYFWTSSKLGDGVWRRGFLNTQENILRNTENPEFGYSVRCVKN